MDYPYISEENSIFADIDFTSTKATKRRIDNATDSSVAATSSCPSQSNRSVTVNPPDSRELESLLESLSQCGSKPAILSLLPRYSSTYVPRSRLSNFPKPLQSLSEPRYEKLSYINLLSICESTTIHVTEEMAQAIEEATRDQSKSKL